MNEINNIQNLDQIVFYTGEHSVTAASLIEDRAFGQEVEGLGTLTKGSDKSIYFSEYPSVKYTEAKMDLQNINDLYSNTLSYLTRINNVENFGIGYTYIANNRYNAIYTYETDLQNDFDFADINITQDLTEFLIGLNTQKYNKTKFYGDKFEVSSIKLGQTYFTWYPKDTVAYVITHEDVKHVDFTYYMLTATDLNAFDGPWDGEDPVYRAQEVEVEVTEKDEFGNDIIRTEFVNEYTEFENLNSLKTYADTYNFYLHKYTYSYNYSEFTYSNYMIGGDNGNYYSYLRQTYDTIDRSIKNQVTYELNLFRDKYNNDDSIYAYYMYDCNADIDLMLTTEHLGVKQSKFKVSFNSLFDKWFDNVININAELNAGDDILKITSANDDKIYSVFKNKVDRITGDNIVINKDQTLTFTTNSAVSLDDEINILTPYEIDTLDLSPIKTKISHTINLDETPWKESGNNLRCLIFDDGNDATKSNLQKIYGLNKTSKLEYINMDNVANLTATPAIDKLENLKVFTAKGSNIDSFRTKSGLELNYVGLPETIKSLKLMGNTFVPGDLMVAGEEKHFDGTLDYTPNSTLSSLTLSNIDNKLSYSLVTTWYDALGNDIDSFKYLELQNINWSDIAARTLIDIKKFDINPNFSGNVSIIGSGNYKWLTRNEYQDIRKYYGLNAFNSSNTVSNKVFKNLTITPKKDKKETFEFSLKAQNNTLAAYNESIADDSTKDQFESILDVEIKGYQYDNNYNESEISPYYNRAANAFLDLIYNDNITSFTFKKDEIDNFASAKLPRTIDTSNSVEIRNIKNGDILLFNGDTLIIYFEDVVNSPYEFIKLGTIIDKEIKNKNFIMESSLQNWFNSEENIIEFIPSKRETVIQELSVELLSESENIIYDQNLDGTPFEGIKISVDIDEYAKEHFDEIENTEIKIRYDETLLHVDIEEDLENHHIEYTLTPANGFTFNSSITSVDFSVFCDANEEDTIVTTEIILRKRIEYSWYDEETQSLMLSTTIYSFDENTNSLVINTQVGVDTHYDEETHTLTID